jgi:hypothetical protein
MHAPALAISPPRLRRARTPCFLPLAPSLSVHAFLSGKLAVPYCRNSIPGTKLMAAPPTFSPVEPRRKAQVSDDVDIDDLPQSMNMEKVGARRGVLRPWVARARRVLPPQPRPKPPSGGQALAVWSARPASRGYAPLLSASTLYLRVDL